MNGEHGQIYNLLTEVQKDITKLYTIEELHHTENKKDLDILFEGQRKIDNLPCKIHVEKFKWHERWTAAIGLGLIYLAGKFFGIL